MPIHVTEDLKPGDLFTKDGKDVWELAWFCTVPSFQMRNLRTGQTENFGQGGETAKAYNAVPPEDRHWIVRAAVDRIDCHIEASGRLLRKAIEKPGEFDQTLRRESKMELRAAGMVLDEARRALQEIVKAGPTAPQEQRE